MFPIGNWKGWYFSEELKYAQSQGYKIKVIKGYSYNNVSNVFIKFVEKLYNLK